MNLLDLSPSDYDQADACRQLHPRHSSDPHCVIYCTRHREHEGSHYSHLRNKAW